MKSVYNFSSPAIWNREGDANILTEQWLTETDLPADRNHHGLHLPLQASYLFVNKVAIGFHGELWFPRWAYWFPCQIFGFYGELLVSMATWLQGGLIAWLHEYLGL